MKHDPRISTSRAAPATPADIRAHLPDPFQCAACHHVDGDCSRLTFQEMPLIAVHADGIAFIDCAQFDRVAGTEA